MRGGQGGHVRAEVQALRAVAVGSVVAFHLFPRQVPGGFVGVDVFFAISGFLITAMLLREIEQTGRVALAGFWARRVRRILPAALLVLAATAVATVLLVPITSWDRYFAELRASAAYVQNWQLAESATDYFRASDPPTPVQHYWTLSMEEQFYLAWPLVLLAVAAATRGRSARLRRGGLGVAMGVLVAAGLVYSVLHTASDPAAAYFVTPARAWEFGLGGLLALAAPEPRGRAAPAAILSWAGIGAILVAVLAFDAATPFPGTAALLPVGGALAAIWAGMPAVRWSPAAAMRLRPVQRLGDLSYSVYLWHWPLIVLAPFVLHHGVGTGTAAAIVVLTLALSIASKTLVEDPARAARGLRGRPGTSIVAGLAGTAAVVAITLAGTGYVKARVQHDDRALRATVAHLPRCFGAASRDRQDACRNPRLAREVVPTPIEAPKLGNAGCRVTEHRGRLAVCAFGVPASRARRTVAVLGDSHAAAWRGALAAVARRQRWHALSLTRTGCPFSSAAPALREPQRSHCMQWHDEAVAWLRSHPQVSAVFVTAHSGARIADTGGRSQFGAQRAAYLRTWRALPSSIRSIVVIRDTPKVRTATLACVQDAMSRGVSSGQACALPRARSLNPDPQAAAAASLPGRAAVVDLTDVFCDARRCYPVIGGALVFRDPDHLTPTFSATLGPQLDRQVEQAGRGL